MKILEVMVGFEGGSFSSRAQMMEPKFNPIMIFPGRAYPSAFEACQTYKSK
jgi:hypothetical protein